MDPIDEYGVILEGLLCHEVDWHDFDSDGMKDISKGDSLQTKRPRCAKGREPLLCRGGKQSSDSRMSGFRIKGGPRGPRSLA